MRNQSTFQQCIQTSYTHQAVKHGHYSLDNLALWLKHEWKTYGYRHKCVFNSCCHVFTTSYHDRKHGYHVDRNGQPLASQLNLEDIDGASLFKYLERLAYSDDQSVLLPGINLSCVNYDLLNRWGDSLTVKSTAKENISEIETHANFLGKRLEFKTPCKENSEEERKIGSSDGKLKKKYGLRKDDMYNLRYIEEKKRISNIKINKQVNSTVKDTRVQGQNIID